MNNREKIGLLFFMIGLTGAAVNREGIIFWVAVITFSIGYWMFVGYDLGKQRR